MIICDKFLDFKLYLTDLVCPKNRGNRRAIKPHSTIFGTNSQYPVAKQIPVIRFNIEIKRLISKLVLGIEICLAIGYWYVWLLRIKV